MSAEPPHANIQMNLQGLPVLVCQKIKEAQEVDKTAEAGKKRWGTIALVLMLLSMAGTFAGGAAEIPPLLIAGLVGFGATLVALTIRWMVGTGDVDDRKLEVAHDLLNVLAPEMRKRPVVLFLDFEGYDRTPPVEDSTGTWSATGVKVFEKPWMRLRFELLDATQVELTIVTKCKRKQKAKRKYTKKKDALVEELTLHFKPSKKKAFDPAIAQRIPQAMKSGIPGLVNAQIKPRAARFCFRTRRSDRTLGRYGWQLGSQRLLTGRAALSAVIMSYRTLASGEGV